MNYKNPPLNNAEDMRVSATVYVRRIMTDLVLYILCNVVKR